MFEQTKIHFLQAVLSLLFMSLGVSLLRCIYVLISLNCFKDMYMIVNKNSLSLARLARCCASNLKINRSDRILL